MSFSQISSVYAFENKTYYARVMFDSVYLYKSTQDTNLSKNVYFELPKTYFVELLSSANEDFYEVRYMDLLGYVKKSCVQAVESAPQKPFLDNITFRVYAEKSQNLMDSASLSSNQVATIPLLTKNIKYYGKINGECLIEGRTNVWYFCSYASNTTNMGYVYSDFCDEMQTISPNTEEVTYINNPTFEQEKTTATHAYNNQFVGIVAVVLTIPAIVFLIMILKGKSILSPAKNREIIDY